MKNKMLSLFLLQLIIAKIKKTIDDTSGMIAKKFISKPSNYPFKYDPLKAISHNQTQAPHYQQKNFFILLNEDKKYIINNQYIKII